MTRSMIVAVGVLLGCVVSAIAKPAAALDIGGSGGAFGSYGLHEEESGFFPGAYYFHKGCDAYARGNSAQAIMLWKMAAGWGQKSAQYDLGIALYKGQGVPIDRAQGLAWLALASERRDAQFQQSFHAAWFEVSDKERAEAQRIHAQLKPLYADAIALRRAARRYEDARRSVTGSRLGAAAGHLRIYAGGDTQGQDGSEYLARVEQAADSYFSSSGSVRVGPLLPADDGLNSNQPTD